MAVDAARHRLRQGERAATCLWRCLGRKRKYAADDGGAWVSRRGHWIGYAAGGAQSSTRRGAIAKSFLALIQTSSLRWALDCPQQQSSRRPHGHVCGCPRNASFMKSATRGHLSGADERLSRATRNGLSALAMCPKPKFDGPPQNALLASTKPMAAVPRPPAASTRLTIAVRPPLKSAIGSPYFDRAALTPDYLSPSTHNYRPCSKLLIRFDPKPAPLRSHQQDAPKRPQ